MSQNFGAQMGGRAKTILLVMGVVFVILGIVMQFALGSLPFAGGAMTSTAVLFIIIGVVEIVAAFVVGRSASATQQVATQGIPGSARIVGLTQTGMSLNDQPQIGMDLEVSVPGQPVYRTSHREFVPLLLLSRLQPGGVLAVRVDPANPQKLVIAWNEPPGMAMGGAYGALMGAAMAPVPGAPAGAGMAGVPFAQPSPLTAQAAAAGVPDESLGQVAAALQAAGMGGVAPVFAQADQANYSVEQLRQWLRANGIPGTARIDLLQDSGQTVGDERLMTMQTTLEVPGRQPFQTAVSAAMVPVAKVGRIAVGVTLPVLIAPDNPNMTMFEWDKI